MDSGMYEPHCALTEAQLATVAEAIARLSSAFLNDVNAQIDWVLQPAPRAGFALGRPVSRIL